MTRALFVSAVALCCAAIFHEPARGQVQRGDLPGYLTEANITCATFAEAINYYIDMGEEKAIAALKAAAVPKPNADREDHTNRRTAFICRVLFEAKGKAPLRQPYFGGLESLPYKTMPLEKWPHYPVARAGSSYFLLSEGYLLAGIAERSLSYIEYCYSEGKFRKDRVPVPNREQALKDIELLCKSEPWKALKWRDQGPGFNYQRSETRVLQYLEWQTEQIPKK